MSVCVRARVCIHGAHRCGAAKTQARSINTKRRASHICLTRMPCTYALYVCLTRTQVRGSRGPGEEHQHTRKPGDATRAREPSDMEHSHRKYPGPARPNAPHPATEPRRGSAGQGRGGGEACALAQGESACAGAADGGAGKEGGVDAGWRAGQSAVSPAPAQGQSYAVRACRPRLGRPVLQPQTAFAQHLQWTLCGGWDGEAVGGAADSEWGHASACQTCARLLPGCRPCAHALTLAYTIAY